MNDSLKNIASVLQANSQGDADITGVAFDSRQVKIGDLFVALVSEHDGHLYIQQALANGAVAVLVDDQHAITPDIPAIIVPDTLLALQRLGQYRREMVNPKVIAITGSNGKTTTKDMTAAILSTKFKTFKTPENYNNEIGVPMTLLSMPDDTEVLVVELGMDRPGQLTVLSHLVMPDIAIITMIGEAHIEFFQTRDNIARAKLEITQGLKSDGILLVPFDEPLLTQAAVKIDRQYFGEKVSAIQALATVTTFTFEQQRFAIPVMGRYNVMNALAAISAGKLLSIDLKHAALALKNFDLTKNRTERLVTSQGVVLISDVYNANPTAVAAVLSTLKSLPARRKYVVLGDMLELGTQANHLHAELGPKILDTDVDGVYLVGSLFNQNTAPLLMSKMGVERVHLYQTDQLKQLASDLLAISQPGDVILLKASHGIHLEKVVQQLTSEQP